MSKKKWLIIGGILLAVAIIATITTIALVRYYSMRGTCGNNLTWVYDGKGTLTISGTGKMEVDVVPEWLSYLEEVDTVVIEEGVQNIAPYAFSRSPIRKQNDALKEVYIADTVTSIDACAFYGCTGLTEINIPENVRTIGPLAFSGCSSLEYVNLPMKLSVIGHSAFENCKRLNNVILPPTLDTIEPNTFARCTSLNGIEIPDSVTAIQGSAFSGCTNLSQVDIPESVGEIGSEAFADCTNLSKIWFNGGLPFDFEYDVFRNVTASVYLPSEYWHYYDNLIGSELDYWGGTLRWYKS